MRLNFVDFFTLNTVSTPAESCSDIPQNVVGRVWLAAHAEHWPSGRASDLQDLPLPEE
jgi:hypothetical protein